MLEKKRDSSVLIELLNQLPDFCQDYFIGRKNERALSTRIGYARDLNHFIDWMIANHREFCRFEGKKTQIRPSDFSLITATDIDKFIEIYSDEHSIRATARTRSAISSFYKYRGGNGGFARIFTALTAAAACNTSFMDKFSHRCFPCTGARR